MSDMRSGDASSQSTPGALPRFTLAPAPEPEPNERSAAPYTDGDRAVLRQISDSEAEIARRLDELEVMFMEHRDRVGDTDVTTGAAAPDGLRTELADLRSEQQRLYELMTDRSGLAALQSGIEQGFDRLAALTGGAQSRLEAERRGLLALQQGVASAAARLGATLDRLEASGHTSSAAAGQDAPDLLEQKVDALSDQIDAAVQTLEAQHAQIGKDLSGWNDRLTAAVGAQDRRLEEERRAMARFFQGLDTVFARLEAATRRVEENRSASCVEQRLDRIEKSLAKLAEAPPQRPDALRELSMIMAEFLARQERRLAAGTAEDGLPADSLKKPA